MKATSDQVNQAPELVPLIDDEPEIVTPIEEPETLQECEYCGHLPCGCGG